MTKSILEMEADRAVVQRIIDGSASSDDHALFGEMADQERSHRAADKAIDAELDAEIERMRNKGLSEQLRAEGIRLLQQTKRAGNT